jgi:hypothetical protein
MPDGRAHTPLPKREMPNPPKQTTAQKEKCLTNRNKPPKNSYTHKNQPNTNV